MGDWGEWVRRRLFRAWCVLLTAVGMRTSLWGRHDGTDGAAARETIAPAAGRTVVCGAL
jgi:hypothetical protein